MKILNLLASSMIAASLVAAPAAFAADPPMRHDMGAMNQGTGMMKHDMDAFMKSCDMDHDGMMSKAEMTKHMEKMFDRMDTKKTGKLDSKQTEAFLKDFTRQSGG
ncbi:MAG: hypothetical protein WC485_10270 [Opitutaceae bacterium]